MGVYIELPKEWAKWSFDVRDIHDNELVAEVTDLDLVRCGECKWCEEKWDSNNNCPTWECKNWFGGTDYDGFCHEGERRSES